MDKAKNLFVTKPRGKSLFLLVTRLCLVTKGRDALILQPTDNWERLSTASTDVAVLHFYW